MKLIFLLAIIVSVAALPMGKKALDAGVQEDELTEETEIKLTKEGAARLIEKVKTADPAEVTVKTSDKTVATEVTNPTTKVTSTPTTTKPVASTTKLSSTPTTGKPSTPTTKVSPTPTTKKTIASTTKVTGTVSSTAAANVNNEEEEITKRPSLPKADSGNGDEDDSSTMEPVDVSSTPAANTAVSTGAPQTEGPAEATTGSGEESTTSGDGTTGLMLAVPVILTAIYAF